MGIWRAVPRHFLCGFGINDFELTAVGVVILLRWIDCYFRLIEPHRRFPTVGIKNAKKGNDGRHECLTHCNIPIGLIADHALSRSLRAHGLQSVEVGIGMKTGLFPDLSAYVWLEDS